MKRKKKIKAEIRGEFVRNQALFRKIGRFQTLQFYLVLAVFGFMFIGSALTYVILILIPSTSFLENVMSVVLVALCACLVFSTIMAAALSRRLMRPMEEIIAASRSAAAGDFSVRVASVHIFGEMKTRVGPHYMNCELSDRYVQEKLIS
jgi:methyl-accepting chemotaxis protein